MVSTTVFCQVLSLNVLDEVLWDTTPNNSAIGVKPVEKYRQGLVL
jgi:hypothetical protein